MMTPADRDAVFKLLVGRLGEEDNWTMPPTSWWKRNSYLPEKIRMSKWNELDREEKIGAWIVATDEDYELVVDALLDWYEKKESPE
jgi:hypothetical protein